MPTPFKRYNQHVNIHLFNVTSIISTPLNTISSISTVSINYQFILDQPHHIFLHLKCVDFSRSHKRRVLQHVGDHVNTQVSCPWRSRDHFAMSLVRTHSARYLLVPLVRPQSDPWHFACIRTVAESLAGYCRLNSGPASQMLGQSLTGDIGLACEVSFTCIKLVAGLPSEKHANIPNKLRLFIYPVMYTIVFTY